MSRYHNTVHTRLSVSEYADYLKRDLQEAAWIDAILMYQSARTSETKVFAQGVLAELGVTNVPEKRLAADTAARELLRCTDQPLHHANKRCSETEMTNDADLQDFWHSVVELLKIYLKDD